MGWVSAERGRHGRERSARDDRFPDVLWRWRGRSGGRNWRSGRRSALRGGQHSEKEAARTTITYSYSHRDSCRNSTGTRRPCRPSRPARPTASCARLRLGRYAPPSDDDDVPCVPSLPLSGGVVSVVWRRERDGWADSRIFSPSQVISFSNSGHSTIGALGSTGLMARGLLILERERSFFICVCEMLVAREWGRGTTRTHLPEFHPRGRVEEGALGGFEHLLDVRGGVLGVVEVELLEPVQCQRRGGSATLLEAESRVQKTHAF